MDTDRPAISNKEALSLITRYCSKEERCVNDARNRLSQFGLSDIDIDQIIEYLKSEKYVDDQRYANAFVNDKFRFNKWGKYKIKMHLKQKCISEETISNAFASISPDDYRDLLANEIKKKLSTLPKTSKFETKGKLYRFAAQRGFENDLINDILNDLLNSD
jgi:regulatory protein